MQFSLYSGDLESNPQYLQDMPAVYKSLSRKYLVQKLLFKDAAGHPILFWQLAPPLKFMVAPVTSMDPRVPFTP